MIQDERLNEELISRVPLFSSLPHREVEHLARVLRPIDCPAEAVLFHEGTYGSQFYILLQGELEIIKGLGTDGERLIAIRDEPSFIGEMSLFSKDGLRTASVRARTPCKLLRMTRAEFDSLLHRYPALAYEMVRLLSLRLGEAENTLVRDLREKNIQLQQAYDDLKASQIQLVEKEKMEAELSVARRIQRNILPYHPPHLAGFDIGMLIEPASSVAGDFFDFIQLPDDQIALIIGDVSDHGVPAAIFMALTFSLLRGELARTSSPGEALNNVNCHLLDMNEADMFVTLLCGILDVSRGEFRFARAGHLPPLVLDGQGRQVEVPRAIGTTLGLFEDVTLDQQSVPLLPGSVLVLHTDGVTEAANPQGELFGVPRLLDVLRSQKGRSAQQICQAVLEAVGAHSGTTTPQDDITLVVVQVEGKAP
jgi:sigma-B regulation protein RsbU (phosphoserine phosphatase)